MKISEIFKLNKTQYELDFIDIDINNEIPLFLDANIFSLKDDVWSQKCFSIISDFFRKVNELIALGDLVELEKICSPLSEPNETCLGYSKGKPQGAFQKKENIIKMFRELYDIKKDTTEFDNVIKTLSDLKLFIKGVNNDTISDIITNLIRMQLIKYTYIQCLNYNIPMENVPSKPYWDDVESMWKRTDSVSQLIIEGRPILLIPKSYVFLDTSYSYKSAYFAQHHVLNFLKDEELKIPTSKLIKFKVPKKGENIGEAFVTKKDLREKYAVDNKDYLLNFSKKYPLIIEKFRKSIHFNSLSIPQLLEASDEPINSENYNSVLDAFILMLKEIEYGKEQAHIYHDFIFGLLTFIFYPNLINPQKETKIADGTKRIDVTYINSSDNGFFYNLKSEYPANYVYIECKNYNTDVNNPEFDQLAGRFNASSCRVGFLVCREILNKKTVLKKVASHYRQQHNLIIPITDVDIIEILNLMKVTSLSDINPNIYDDYLYDLKRKIEVVNY